MLKFDHLTIPVSNWTTSRDWYVDVLGLKVEFEVPQRYTAAVKDQHGFTIFLVQQLPPPHAGAFSLTFQVEDELCDPDGYIVRLWDEKSMKAKG